MPEQSRQHQQAHILAAQQLGRRHTSCQLSRPHPASSAAQQEAHASRPTRAPLGLEAGGGAGGPGGLQHRPHHRVPPNAQLLGPQPRLLQSQRAGARGREHLRAGQGRAGLLERGRAGGHRGRAGQGCTTAAGQAGRDRTARGPGRAGLAGGPYPPASHSQPASRAGAPCSAPPAGAWPPRGSGWPPVPRHRSPAAQIG